MASYHYVPYGEYQCANCGNQFEGIVCNLCGQHPVEEKLTLKVLWKEWRERRRYDSTKLFKTVKALVLQPGTVIKEYLEGKRHTWYNAVNFFLLVASLTAFVTLQFSAFDAEESIKGVQEMYKAMNVPESQQQSETMIAMFGWMQAHYNVVLLFALPFMSLASWFLFRKRGYSWGEHIILHCYAYGFVNLLTVPFLLFFNPFEMGGIWQGSMTVLYIAWYTWIFRQVFDLSWGKGLGHTILWYLLYIVVIFLVSLVAAIIGAIVAIVAILAGKALGLIG